MNDIYEHFIFLEIIKNIFQEEEDTEGQMKKDIEESEFSDYIKKDIMKSDMASYDILNNNMPNFQKYKINKKHEENKNTNKQYNDISTNTQYNDNIDNSNIISQSLNSHTNTHFHNKIHKCVQCDDIKPTNEQEVYVDNYKNMKKYINIDQLNDHQQN